MAESIDDKYLEMATKIVAAAVGNTTGNLNVALTYPDKVTALFSAIAKEIYNLRIGQY
jgi:hypothetical protein